MSREVFVTDGEYIAAAHLWLNLDDTVSWDYTGLGPITHWCEKSDLLPDIKKEDLS